MNTPLRYLLSTFKASLFFAWLASSAATAAVSFSSKGSDVILDPTVTILTCVLSTLSGATALFIRINNLLLEQENQRVAGEEPHKFVRPWLFATAHMLGSWLAGTVGFLIGRVNDWNVWMAMLGVILLSFGGAKALEYMAEKFYSNIPLGAPPPTPKKA